MPKSRELSEDMKIKAFNAAMKDEYFSSRFIGSGPDDCWFSIRDENPIEGTLSIQIKGPIKADPEKKLVKGSLWMVDVSIEA